MENPMHTFASSSVERRHTASVIILGPRQLCREALRSLLETSKFSVMGDGRTIAEAMTQDAPNVMPDLIIYGLRCDEEVEEHFPLIETTRAKFKTSKTVVLADCVQTGTKLRTIRLGVEAFLTNDVSAVVLERTLELILLGQRLLPAGLVSLLPDPRQSDAVVDAVAPEFPLQTLQERSGPDVADLSAREQQILRCLVDGLTNKAIARGLAITEATVKVHIKALLRKTRMANRTQAAIWGLNNSRNTETVKSNGHVRSEIAANWRGEAMVEERPSAIVASRNKDEGGLGQARRLVERLEAKADLALLDAAMK